MKNINIKISRDFVVISLLLIILCIPVFKVSANLDKKFRENFSEIVRQQYFNSIDYSVDDITGFVVKKKDGKDVWSCSDGKCAEYQKTISCLFDDAFENAVNQTNAKIKDFLKNKNFAGLSDIALKDANCKEITVQRIQERQESNGFKSSCSGEFVSEFYSSCRVSETVLNELGAYQNYLLAKSRDEISFSRENFEHDDFLNEVLESAEKAKSYYVQELKKSQKAALTTLTLYKDFVHNYRTHAWLIAVKEKLKNIQGKWLKIQKAIDTFPAKFVDANSVGG